MNKKPLGHKAYGSIPHLPGSRLGNGDHHCNGGQARIATVQVRDGRDRVIVQEKVDGSCCAVALVNGEVIALGRAGYRASTSPYEQHHLFAAWVAANRMRFWALLQEGERAVGEWMALAHGTRYNLPHEPFVIFDLMTGQQRQPHAAVEARCEAHGFVTPRVIHEGGAMSIEGVLAVLEPSGHGALDPVEGAIWRVERDDAVDFLVKYVRPGKQDGCYLPEVSGKPPIWNWSLGPIGAIR